jgi:uncharacterized membrane protein
MSSQEARIFMTGVILGSLWICALLVFWLCGYSFPLKLLSMVATHLIGGRAGGISVGLEMGLPEWLIVFNAFFIDSLIVLLVYPLFVLSTRKTLKSGFVQDFLDASIKTAKKERKRVRRFGMVGLLFFVWFPLHMTGPLVGAIIGYFLRLKPYVNISVVLCGTFLAVVSWVIFFRKIISISGEFSFLIPVVVIVMALIVFLVLRTRNRKEAN